MTGIISTIIVGAVAGYLASIVVGTNRQQGCLTDIVVGVIGSFVGSLVVPFFFPGGLLGGGLLGTILTATVGAILFLVALQLLFPRRRRRR